MQSQHKLCTFWPNNSAWHSPRTSAKDPYVQGHTRCTEYFPDTCLSERSLALSPLTHGNDELAACVQDYFILSEMEAQEARHKEPEMGWQTTARLQSLASNQFSRPDSERRGTMDSQMSESLLGTSDFPQV